MYVLPYYNNYCNTRYLIIYSVYREASACGVHTVGALTTDPLVE